MVAGFRAPLTRYGRGHLGVDFAARGRLTDEAIDEIRAAFTDEFVHDAGMRPRPRQARLPIWVGGSSKPALRRAAARGDGWLPQGTPRSRLAESMHRISCASG